ncbi:MAG: NIPSNAP family protein, partial [Planctomycetota bacterium]
PVGVFTEVDDASLDVHVLLSFDRPEQFLSERTALEQDDTYRRAAEEHLAATKRDPAFARIDSTLMIAFAGQPRLSVPTNRSRVFELRTYESHSEAKARRKVEMFNEGEIPIFLKAGFETVFFGEALCGAGLPHLKYLLASDSMRANKANWAAFRKHPDWRAMKNLPRYADTVSNIDKLFLEPTGFSEV